MDGESELRVLRREKSWLMPGRGGRQRPVPGQALTMRVQREPGHVLVAVAVHFTGLDRRLTVGRTVTEALQPTPQGEHP